MRTKKDKCTKIIKYFIKFFCCFSVKVVKSHTRLLNPYYKGLKVKKKKETFQNNTFLVKQSFNKLIKFSFLMNIIQKRFDSLLYTQHFYSQVLFLK